MMNTIFQSDQFSNLFKTYFAFSPNIILAHEYLVDYHSLDQQIDCLTNSIGKSFGNILIPFLFYNL